MEIIHLILGKANPERLNGVNNVVYHLATAQAELGYSVSVWGATLDTSLNFEQRNFSTVLYKYYRNPFCMDAELSSALKNLKKDTFIHIHGGFIPLFYKVSRVLKKCGINYLFTPHGSYNVIAMQRNYLIKRIYFNYFESKLLSDAFKLHFIGRSEIDGCSKLFSIHKYCLIPNGFDIKEIVFEPKSLKTENVPIFGFCGRIDAYTKGLDILLKGFADFIHHENNDARLWIVGDGSDIEKVKKWVKEFSIEQKVVFWGKRFGSEKFNILSQMDAFFHPSRNEGMPTAVLEASAMKIPCVVSYETNISEFISNYNAGIALEKNDAEHMEKAMTTIFHLWQTNNLQTWKDNCSAMIQKEFDWKVIAQRLLNEYSV